MLLGLVLGLVTSTALAAQGSGDLPSGTELPTDSLTGTLVGQLSDGFVLRTDDDEEIFFAFPSDSLPPPPDEAEADSVRRSVPHATVMDRRDILFVLRQLQESDERDRMHVHFVELDGDPGRVVIWVSVAQDRIPGG
ncbi:MAG: hypothetical protein U5R14_11445 [Gemmatimonadota bacterium]|nr:hypothetical protein [Gemmatimonadota bacterium]